MHAKDDRRLRIGVLGCGPIAQSAHFDACRQGAQRRAVRDLRRRRRPSRAHGRVHAPQKAYADYDAMLADPDVEAVIVAIADPFHVPAVDRAIGPASTCCGEAARRRGGGMESAARRGRALRGCSRSGT